MKFLLVLVLALSSCQNWIMSETSSTLVPDPDTPISYRFATPAEAWAFIDLGIEYRADNEIGYLDYWQSPVETVACLAGDCEDKAILFMHLLDRMGLESTLVIALYPGNLSHAFVRCGGELFGAFLGYDSFEVQKELGYADALLSLGKYKRKL